MLFVWLTLFVLSAAVPCLSLSIKSDTIGDVSIKLQFNNDAKWTKALKNMLVVCRQLLLWFVTSKHAKNTQ